MQSEMKSKAAEFKQQHNRKRRACAVLAALAIVVGVGTVWALVQPASAMEGKLICEQSEHMHSETCYARSLVCGLEEDREHTHTDACWAVEQICQLEEHTHTETCYEKIESQSKPESEADSESQQDTPDNSTHESVSRPESKPETESNEQNHQNSKPDSEQNNGTSAKTETETPADDSASSKPDAEADANSDSSQEQAPLLEELPNAIPAEYTDVHSVTATDGVYIRVYARPNTLPENVEVRASLFNEQDMEYSDALQRLQDAGIVHDFVTAMDISLYNEQGQKIEPNEPVYVELEAAGLMARESDVSSIQIQHHKEIVSTEGDGQSEGEQAVPAVEPQVVLQEVLNSAKGLLSANTESASFTATFAVDSFSVFTITSNAWKELKIRVECVDERGDALPVSTQDITLNIPQNDNYSIYFMQGNGVQPQIPGYQFDDKAYYIKNGEYDKRIYGIRTEKGVWYYIDRKDSSGASKQKFEPQPNFVGENPTDSIRLIYKKVSTIPVSYVDIYGKPLNQEDAPNGKNPDNIVRKGHSLKTTDVDSWPMCNKYYYIGKAYINESKPDNEIEKVFEKGNKVYALTAEGLEVELSEQNRLNLVYSPNSNDPVPGVHTGRVSTKDKGMIINIFDYNSGTTFGPDEPINKDKHLQFVLDGSRKEPYNKWTGKDEGIYTGIVQEKLGEDGYPVLNVGTKESLRYLFDPEMCREDLKKNNGKGMISQVHTNLDKLFYLDMDGYYRYDAMTTFATVMPENETLPNDTSDRDFIVYRQPALPGQNATGDNPKFLPFNKYSEANRPTKDPASQERTKQFHFGMTMETPFAMPIDGQVPDGSGNHTAMRDMVFEFNGDDDVWLFIDGKLALDLGGIHDRYGGKINFHTGEVTTNAPPTEHSGRRQRNIYGIEDPSKLTEEELREAREKAGFGRFTQHTMKFFYLERGRGASNCEIHFNLVPVAHGFAVGKRLATNADISASDHTGHQFQVEVEYPGEPKKTLVGAEYALIQCKPEDDPLVGGKPIDAGRTDERGRFWLHAGQRADFTNVIDLKATGVTDTSKVKIYVSEVVPQHQQEHIVRVWRGKEEEDGTYLVADNGKRKLIPPLYDSAQAIFHQEERANIPQKLMMGDEYLYQYIDTSGRHNEFNWIDFENNLGELASLNITKQAFRTASDIPITDPDFSMKIELWDEIKNEWIPLDEGTPYWILDKDTTEPTQGQTPKRLDKNANGQIAIKHNQKIHLKLVPGTRYRVSEVLDGEDAEIYTTTYTGEVQSNNGTSGQDEFEIQTQDQKQTGIGNKNEITAGAVHNVLITNKSSKVIAPKGSFALTKRVEGETIQPEDTQFKFELRIKDYKPTSSNQTEPIQCVAFYHDTPASITRTDGPINFEIDPVSKEPVANVSLYRGETIVITGLPMNHSMGVHEKLTEEQDQIYEVSIQENKQSVTTGASLDKTVGQINANGVLRVVCTNRSKLKNTTSLQISKEVRRTDQLDGKPTPEDMAKDFQFSITLLKPREFTNQDIKATITNGAESREVTLQFKPNANDYTASTVLKHGEILTVPGLPRDVEVIVQEISHAGYAVSMNKKPGDRITVHLKTNTGDPYRVDCVNVTGVKIPETGGHGRLPYAVMGSLLVCASGWMLYQKRKRGKNA